MQLGRLAPRTRSVAPGHELPAAATASLAHVASTVDLLALALDDDLAFFVGLLRRGMLDAAVEHARHAATEARRSDEAAAVQIERSVLGALLEARRATAVAGAEPTRLAAALDRGRTAARTLAGDR